MITVDEARERAREWAGEDADLGIYEFGAGYVVWVVGPQPTEENPGGRRAVVDKHTGALTRYGSLPARVIADRYGREVAARRRFPDRVLGVIPIADDRGGRRQWGCR